MKILFDYLPIICFFIAYKIAGIYVATEVLVVGLFALVFGYWFKFRRIHKMHLATAVLALIFGGLTVWLRDPAFIEMKPTILYLLFAGVLLASHFVGAKPLIRRMLESNLTLPPPVWTRVSWLWIGFFVISAILNTYVAMFFSQSTWVSFKLFGMLGLTVVFILIQSIYLARHMPEGDDQSSE